MDDSMMDSTMGFDLFLVVGLWGMLLLLHATREIRPGDDHDTTIRDSNPEVFGSKGLLEKGIVASKGGASLSIVHHCRLLAPDTDALL